MTDLTGKIAIVTGGTQGLRQAVAERFAACGAEGIVIIGRNRERGESVAASISAAGCRTRFIAGCCSDQASRS